MSGTLYPGSLDNGTSLPDPGANSDTAAFDHAGLHDTENAAIKALETKLGTGSSVAATGTVLRGTGSGTTAFGSVSLTADVSGALSVSNGGTGASTAANARTNLGLGSLATQSIVTLTTDVTGTLPVANGGTGTTTSTGTGNTVLSGSPTIVTPTIANFTNATHDHTNASGGGQLPSGGLGTDSSWAWATWTPTWTNLTIGDGAVVGRVAQIGKFVFFRLQLTFGSTTAVTGIVNISLPVTAKTSSFPGLVHCNFFDSSSSSLIDGTNEIVSTTVFSPTSFLVSGTAIVNLVMTATNPFGSWAVSDQLRCKGWYEAS